MNEKKKNIMDVAIKLFATKGSASTSIREIASESGISKGAFYLHFESKDDLKLTIFQYYLEHIQNEIKKYEALDIPVREKLTQQLEAYFIEMLKQKDILVLQFREQVLYRTDAVDLYFKNLQKEKFAWYHKRFIELYGEAVRPYLNDLTYLFEGMMQSYFRLMIKSETDQFNFSTLAAFLIHRLDDIVAGLLKRAEKPMVTVETTSVNRGKIIDTILVNISEMAKIVAELPEEDQEHYADSLTFLKDEIIKDNPKKFMIKGMLSNLAQNNKLKKYTKEIERFIAIEKEN